MSIATAWLLAAAVAGPPPSDLRCGSEAVADRGTAPGDALSFRFMGTSTLLFEDGETQILFDGYFSRPALLRAAVGRVSPDCERISEAVRKAGISRRLRAVFVAHAHIDHVLDAPEIAGMTGAQLLGSSGVANVAAGHGLPRSRFTEIANGTTYCVGDFKVTPISIPHSTPNAARGAVRSAVPRTSWALRYRDRGGYAFLIEHMSKRLLLYPSAAYWPGNLRKVRAETVFLGIAGLGRKRSAFADAYWAEVVEAVGGRLVHPIHWDNFGRRLRQPLQAMPWPFDDVTKGRARVKRLAELHDVNVEELQLFTSRTAVSFETAAPTSGGEHLKCVPLA